MKKESLGTLLACVAIIAEIMLLSGCREKTGETSPRDYAEIAASGVLRVVTDYSPLTYYMTDDSITGFDYELLQMIGKRTNLKIEITPEVSLTKSLEGLDDRSYDVIARLLPVTTENKQKYIFTKPLQLNKQVLVQRRDSSGNVAIRNQLDLGQCTLHIAQDAPTRLRIENLAHEIGDTIYIKEEPDCGAEQLIILVASGVIDYAVCDEAEARAIGDTYDAIDCQTDISFTQFMAWTLRQESTALCDSLNRWIDEISRTKEYKSLKEKYFGNPKKR